MIKTYSELITFNTFEDRYNYLKLNGVVGEDIFGHNRLLNQKFYNSIEWRRFRDSIIIRDNGCDLGVPGYEIPGIIHIHHLNPITKEDLINRSKCLVDPENVICISPTTHRYLTYGSDPPIYEIKERFKNDTCPWK